MKVLFDHSTPFALAHGGFQIQIEQTKHALSEIGVEVEWLRWWDDTQRGDLVHYFGRPNSWYVEFAQKKEMKVVVSDLLTGLGSRSAPGRKIQQLVIGVLKKSYFFDRMGWNTYRFADALIALTPWEAELMQSVFGAPADRVHVVPNGVEREFLDSATVDRGNWLVCTATIAQRKRVLELARAATEARTPVWIIGRPYSDSDPYAKAFISFARANQEFVRYEGAINDRSTLAGIYRAARGFVLLSAMESLSLSALEAAACECPLLLSDLPWATTTFGSTASYCHAGNEVESLRRFYSGGETLPRSERPKSWRDIAMQLRDLYLSLNTTAR